MSHNGIGKLQFYNAKHHHRGQAHKHVRKRRQADRRRTDRAHRVGALPPSHPGLCGTLVGPGKDTHATPVPLWREAVGGPRHAPRDTTKTTTPRFAAPRLGYQHGSGAGLLKPQMYEAATELGDKNSSRVHHRSKTKPKSFVSESVEVPQVQLESILVTPSRTERQCLQ